MSLPTPCQFAFEFPTEPVLPAAWDLSDPPRATLTAPSFHPASGLWFYGNARLLLGHLAYVEQTTGPATHPPDCLEIIEREAEAAVLDSKILVCGIHSPAHQRSAVVPLRWGAPRIVVLSGGFYHHLGPNLEDELFRAARLWRYRFDQTVDLVISRRAPEKKPTFALHNPTVDRLIRLIGSGGLK